MKPKINVVLVHGAWADGSGWSKVIPILEKQGFNVTAAQLPLTSLNDDIAVTRRLLSTQKGSYGPCGSFLRRCRDHQCSERCAASHRVGLHRGLGRRRRR